MEQVTTENMHWTLSFPFMGSNEWCDPWHAYITRTDHVIAASVHTPVNKTCSMSLA